MSWRQRPCHYPQHLTQSLAHSRQSINTGWLSKCFGASEGWAYHCSPQRDAFSLLAGFFIGNVGSASVKIPLAASNKINSGKISGDFRLAQQHSDLGWHIVLCGNMAARAPDITSSCNCIWRQKGVRFSSHTPSFNQPREWGKKFPGNPLANLPYWPQISHITAREAGKPNISAYIMGGGSSSKGGIN